jgi:hypothetical protein
VLLTAPDGLDRKDGQPQPALENLLIQKYSPWMEKFAAKAAYMDSSHCANLFLA